MSRSDRKTYLVTGGAGFIGSALVRHLIREMPSRVVVLDKLGYAGHRASLAELANDPRFAFERLDVSDQDAVADTLERHEPDAVLHLAAETHVDRSIDDPRPFLESNIAGTFALLEAVRRYWRALPEARKAAFRFLHVSTDEVFGSLGAEGVFSEESRYHPRSPYAASKAASDHLVRAWHHTYGLPVLVTNCSNNYGPRQHPEKLVPTAILKASAGEVIPLYGSGRNVRDWLYVEDHARALLHVLEHGAVGESYAIGTRNERSNLEVVRSICRVLDELLPAQAPHARLIAFVEDRPGHDFRYAIDPRKLEHLGWSPLESFESGLRQTVAWYLANPEWCQCVVGEGGRLERLGLAGA